MKGYGFALTTVFTVMVTGVAQAASVTAAEQSEAKKRGRVVDVASGRPISGARVEVVNTTLATTTNEDGEFAIDGILAEPLSVRASADGYEIETRALPDANAGQQLELRLKPRAIRFSDAVVVAGARTETHVSDLPRSVTVLTANDLARSLARTTPEALMDVPGVLVQKTNHGGGSPYLRGLVGNQVLVLVDGIRLNNSTFRYGPNQYLATVDVGQIERIEVVRGSGSVLFGSDALGGVINIVTKRPTFASQSGITFNGGGTTRFVSDGMERSGRFELAASGTRAAVFGGISLRDYGELHAGGNLGVEAPSAYTELNGDVKALVRLTPRNVLTIAAQNVHQDDVPRFDQVAQRGFSRYSFDPQVRRLGYVQWQSLPASAWIQSVTSTVSFHQSVERRDRQQRGSPTRILEQDDVRTLGGSVELKTTPLGRWSIVSGVDVTRDEIGSWRRDTNDVTGQTQSRRGLYPDGATAWSAAGFAHGTWTRPHTSIEAGVRFSQYAVEADDALFGHLEIRPSAWVGNVGVLQDLAGGFSVFGSVAQAFRAPNVDDMSTLGSFDFGIEVPSTSLQPERSLSVEGGLRMRRSLADASVALYRMNLEDLIDRVRSTFDGLDLFEGQPVYRRANVGKAYVYGVESEGEWRPTSQFSVFGHLTYTYGQQTTANQPMRRIPPLNGLAGVRVPRLGRAWLEGTARFATKQDRLSSGDRDDYRIPAGGTPGWVVVSMSTGLPIWPSLHLVGGVHNLFNEAYRVHGSGIDGYGRAAWIGTDIKF